MIIEKSEHENVSNSELGDISLDELKSRISYDTWKLHNNKVNLIHYEFDSQFKKDGLYAYYRIGTEWLDKECTKAIVVTPKIPNIDFMKMFMICLKSEVGQKEFSSIYSIDFEQPKICSKSLNSILTPLLIVHFLSIVKNIVKHGVKKGYVNRESNLNKVRGRIDIRKNERMNIATKHYEKVFCNYQEFSKDIPENRLIKKALIYSHQMLELMKSHSSYNTLSSLLNYCLSNFEGVNEEIEENIVCSLKINKLYKDYEDAIRISKIILRKYDYSLKKITLESNYVPVFRIDMSLLYEHFVYSLLNQAYPKSILYQKKGNIGVPDFIFSNGQNKAILDTKYITEYQNNSIKLKNIFQLSGYCRDLEILRLMGINIEETSQCPIIPSIIIYPDKSSNNKIKNPFLKLSFNELLKEPLSGCLQFYKYGVSLPKNND
jgi:5-methylcytosine-specific restriction enzyme subunit McrC